MLVAPARERPTVSVHPGVVGEERRWVVDGDDQVVVGQVVDGLVRPRTRAREDERTDRGVGPTPGDESRENIGLLG